jgi:hypothetical protein
MIGGWCGGAYFAWQQWTPGFLICFAIAFPSIFFVVIVTLSTNAYYFDFTALGRRFPADPPAVWQCTAVVYSWIGIGNSFRASAPLARWSIGPGGMQLKVLVAPDTIYPPVFLAASQIQSITADWWGNCLIEHTSAEIRSPIKASRSVLNVMQRENPELMKLFG